MSICTSLSNLVRLCVVVSLLLAGCNKKNDSTEAAREGIRTRIKQNQRPAPVTSHHAKLPPIAWTAKADPPQQTNPPTSLNISELEFKDAGNLIYPTSPGKFVVVAPNGRKDGLYHLVNLESGETIGEAPGSLDIREPMTISADGKAIKKLQDDLARVVENLPLPTYVFPKNWADRIGRSSLVRKP